MACPAAAMTMSASRMILLGSVVWEWTILTVASAFKRRSETGNPTILLRPTTTAFLPFMLMPLRDRSSRQPYQKRISIMQKIRPVGIQQRTMTSFTLLKKQFGFRSITFGVQGWNRGSLPFIASFPMFRGWNPSTSFSMLISVKTLSSLICLGNGSWTSIPGNRSANVKISYTTILGHIKQ